MGNQKNTKNKLNLEKFRVTEIKNSNKIYGGAINEGANPACSVTRTKDKNKGNQLLP